MLTQRDPSAQRPSVRHMGSAVGGDRRLPTYSSGGRREAGLPLPADKGRLAAHTGVVF